MSDTKESDTSGTTAVPTPRRLPPAAERALAEAADRRRAGEQAAPRPKEVHGPGGLEPVRYGDWERKGLASDF